MPPKAKATLLHEELTALKAQRAALKKEAAEKTKATKKLQQRRKRLLKARLRNPFGSSCFGSSVRKWNSTNVVSTRKTLGSKRCVGRPRPFSFAFFLSSSPPFRLVLDWIEFFHIHNYTLILSSSPPFRLVLDWIQIFPV